MTNIVRMVDKFPKICRVVGIIAVIIPILSCSGGGNPTFKDVKLLMGTVVEITVAHPSERQARRAIAEAFKEIERVDELFSGFKPESLVSQINREGFQRAVPVGREVIELLKEANAISAASSGAFDVTIRPVFELWGFADGGKRPSPEDIAEKLPYVGYRNLIIHENSGAVGFAINGMGIELGAIAKGWAVDQAIGKLKAEGISNAIIDAGGDLRIIGSRPGKEYWRIGVQHPRETGQLLLTFDLRETAIVTSGDYERFFLEDGVRYHHILDPATGLPARFCQSVTVLAPTAAEADACATAAFVLGPQRGLDFLRARPGVGGVIVDAGGGVHWTDEALARKARR